MNISVFIRGAALVRNAGIFAYSINKSFVIYKTVLPYHLSQLEKDGKIKWTFDKTLFFLFTFLCNAPGGLNIFLIVCYPLPQNVRMCHIYFVVKH